MKQANLRYLALAIMLPIVLNACQIRSTGSGQNPTSLPTQILDGAPTNTVRQVSPTSEQPQLPPSPTAQPTEAPQPTAPLPTAIPTATAVPTATVAATSTPTIEPSKLAIVDLTLNDIDDTPLQHLSIDEHPYFGGNTLVNGTIAVTGDADAELTDVVLEIEDANKVIVSASLAESTRIALLQPFGDDERVEITTSQLLFAIPSTTFEPLDQTQDGWLSLRVRVRDSKGNEFLQIDGWAGKLVRYTAANRFYVGEEHQGGNDWVKPSVRSLLEEFDGVLIGDISNMNGGSFPPHLGHLRGVDIDLWFPGYDALDGAAAQYMLQLLGQLSHVEWVAAIYVAYQQVEGDPFWSVVRDATLTDGRPASEVFVPDPGHYDHFHLYIDR